MTTGVELGKTVTSAVRGTMHNAATRAEAMSLITAAGR
jgi:hypothetical protein